MALPGVYIEPQLLDSKAFGELSSAEMIVFFRFLRKRRIRVIGSKKGKKRKTIVNNGEIVFPYSEAVKIDRSRSTFQRSIDKLIKVGFIDIAKAGNGQIKGMTTKYSISSRWEHYGTEKFEKKYRTKDERLKNFGIIRKQRERKERERKLIPAKFKTKPILKLRKKARRYA
jgi:hypothetical protein